MPQVRQVVEMSTEEIKKVLEEHAKGIITENGGKQVQGKVTTDFKIKHNHVGEGSWELEGAVVNFERAGR